MSCIYMHINTVIKYNLPII